MTTDAVAVGDRNVTGGVLVLLRLYLGVVFALAGWGKVTGGFDIARSLDFLMERSHGFYVPFLENVVLPSSELFNVLIPYGEFLGGVALILGAFTRLAATGIALMTLNFMLLKGAWFWQNGSNDAAFFFIALALLLGSAGRMLGVDAVLAKKSPKGWLW